MMKPDPEPRLRPRGVLLLELSFTVGLVFSLDWSSVSVLEEESTEVTNTTEGEQLRTTDTTRFSSDDKFSSSFCEGTENEEARRREFDSCENCFGGKGVDTNAMVVQDGVTSQWMVESTSRIHG